MLQTHTHFINQGSSLVKPHNHTFNSAGPREGGGGGGGGRGRGKGRGRGGLISKLLDFFALHVCFFHWPLYKLSCNCMYKLMLAAMPKTGRPSNVELELCMTPWTLPNIHKK